MGREMHASTSARSPTRSPARTLAAHRPRVGHQVAFLSILGFWLFYTIITMVRAAVLDFPTDQTEMSIRRFAVVLVGIAVTTGLYFLVRLFNDKPLGVRIASAFVGAVPCALLIALFTYYVFNIYDPTSLFEDQQSLENFPRPKAEVVILEVAISRYFFLIAWATMYLALSYAGEVRAAERRAARFAQAAQAAELRSLRYQVNPHFLFNTLNSLSTLVLRDRPEEAEAMIMNLSTFYRTSLSGDQLEDVSLEDEVKLQQLYLDIEAVRFPDRLVVEIAVPERLLDALVPGLILQPLVENAIKYGVSRATRPVRVQVAAHEEDGMLVVSVADDGDVLPGDADKGSGIGLANVRDRLEARFGVQASLVAGPGAQGGFVATITLPLVRHG